MSNDHRIYVGAYVYLADPIDKDPIETGDCNYYGCEEHGPALNVSYNGRERAKFCGDCGEPYTSTVKPMLFDCTLYNVWYENMIEHPMHVAVSNIGWLENVDEDAFFIGVDDPECSIEMPEIGYQDAVSYIDRPTLAPGKAVIRIEVQHEKAIQTLREYFETVEIRYGAIYSCY